MAKRGNGLSRSSGRTCKSRSIREAGIIHKFDESSRRERRYNDEQADEREELTMLTASKARCVMV